MKNLPTEDFKPRVVMNLLDFDRIPKVVGKGPLERMERLFTLMVWMKKSFYFIGPASTGKTVIGMNLCKRFAEEVAPLKKAYIVQISPETTKGSLGIGKQLINGTLVTVKGCLAVAAEEGVPILIDEAQQGTQEVLATTQSLGDRGANLTDGTEIVYPKDTFRIIYASNSSQSHAANVPLPQAFATRLVTEAFDYPAFDDEVEITKSIAKDPQVSELKLTVPDPVIRYVVGLMRDHRSHFYPLGPRNSAACVVYMNVLATKHFKGFNNVLAKHKAMSVEELTKTVRSKYSWFQGQNTEMFLVKLYTLMHDKEPGTTVEVASDEDVREFLEYICAYGTEELYKAVNANFMLDLDIDSSFHNIDETKEKIRASLPSPPKAKN